MRDFIITYIVVANLMGVIFMLADKRRASRRQWRIPERTLFLTAAVGGSIGILTGMYLFRHKTKHKAFVWGVPLILLIQAALWILFMNNL